MKVSVFFYIFASAVVFALPIYFMKGAIACEMTESLGFVEIRPNVFVSIESSKIPEDILFIDKGIERVNDIFGPTISSPKWVIADSTEETRKFFASETATSHFSPFSNCLVLGPKGQNIDVAAHELVHAEIYKRLGWLKQILKMPRWFEEGVSLMVDWREPFLPENIQLSDAEILSVKQHFYGHQFYTTDSFTHYQASRMAVGALDASTFYESLEQLRNGGEFDDVFDM